MRSHMSCLSRSCSENPGAWVSLGYHINGYAWDRLVASSDRTVQQLTLMHFRLQSTNWVWDFTAWFEVTAAAFATKQYETKWLLPDAVSQYIKQSPHWEEFGTLQMLLSSGHAFDWISQKPNESLSLQLFLWETLERSNFQFYIAAEHVQFCGWQSWYLLNCQFKCMIH